MSPLDANEHGLALHAAYSDAADPGDWTYLPYGPFLHESEFVAWLNTIESESDPAFYSIVDLGTGAAAGLASHLRIDPSSASIEVGHIHMARCLQRTAAATEAMYLMMSRAFSSGYRRYEWKCDALNAPSRSAAARLGFTYEGTFRQATHYKGRNRDTAWFSILDAEWPALEREFERWLEPGNFDGDGEQKSPLRMTNEIQRPAG
ncbi:MAG: GNAT family N-acetyltransferase [Acidimicrobiales bacterium]